MMIQVRFALLWALMTIGFHAESQNLLMEKARPLVLKAMLQGPDNWESSLDGKVVVLEFWATWCTPCMANLAHMNELSRHFTDSNVQFISITDEPLDKIKEFLGKRKMNGWVGIDSGQLTFKNYGVKGMPHTFVIDANGIIRFSNIPDNLNEKVIREIKSGNYQPQILNRVDTAPIFGGWSPGEDPVYTAHFGKKYLSQQTIRPSDFPYPGSGFWFHNGFAGYSMLGFNLPMIIAFTEALPGSLRVINKSAYPDSLKWDVIFSRAKGYDRKKASSELRKSVFEAFVITIADTQVEKSVLIPKFDGSSKVIEEKTIDFNKPETHTYHSLKSIFDQLENNSGKIIDYPANSDTKYLDLFDIMGSYFKMNAEEVQSWLDKQGITFTPGIRKINMKVIHDQ